MPTNNSINISSAGIVGYNGAGVFAGSSLTTNAVVYAGSSDTLTSQALTNGQLQIGSTGAAPTAGTITAGTGISVTNGAGTITIANTAVALVWTGISAPQTGVAENGYYVTSGNQALTLPASAAAGTYLAIYAAKGSTGWTIVQGAGQSIQLGNTSTTVGAGGSLASTSVGDGITMLCTVANTTWLALDSVGNITVV
jgi:hypothetical protein